MTNKKQIKKKRENRLKVDDSSFEQFSRLKIPHNRQISQYSQRNISIQIGENKNNLVEKRRDDEEEEEKKIIINVNIYQEEVIT